MSNSQKEIAAPSQRKYFTSKRIATTAMLVALSIVIKLIGNTLTLTETFRVSFIYTPWILSGIILGPLGGCIVSGMSDILVMLMLGGTFIPLTFVSNLIYPLLPAIIYRLLPRTNDYIKVILGCLLSLIICTLGIGSYALYTFYGYSDSYSFLSYLIIFRTAQIPVLMVNTAIICLLIKPLKNAGIIKDDKKLPSTAAFIVSQAVLTVLFAAGLILLISFDLTAAPLIVLVSCYLLISLYLWLIRIKGAEKYRLPLAFLTLAILLIVAFIIKITGAGEILLPVILGAGALISLILSIIFFILAKTK